MKNTQIILGGILVIALLMGIGPVAALDNTPAGEQGTGDITDDIMPYNGTIGADSPVYGLKIAMEDLDETFTFNTTQRVEKQVDHARLRIAEVKRELSHNRTDTAERALELYRQKLNMTEGSLAPFGSNATGLLHAQEMITRHQAVLARLLIQYPNNTGLARAYNNSLFLEEKFGEKTEMRFARFIEKNNKTVIKAVRLEIRNQNRMKDDTATITGTMEQEREKIKDQKDMIEINRTNTLQTWSGNDTPKIMKNTQGENASSGNKGKNGRV
ncbi:MAG: DUF5667 domain-containing protein [Methanoregula sp.]|nr:DUF5667 domain-containing protein [Methanoregula sp.]